MLYSFAFGSKKKYGTTSTPKSQDTPSLPKPPITKTDGIRGDRTRRMGAQHIGNPAIINPAS
jgi:hypothetical protein